MRNVLLVGVSVFALSVGSAMAAPLVDVDDTGSNNSSNISQDADDTLSSVTVIQSQDGLNAAEAGMATGGLNVFVQQTSTNVDSTVRVEQVDGGGLGGGNAASVDQNVGLTISTADVLQDGLQNGADVVQNGEGQFADIDQMGSTNSASIAQAINGNSATINQNGDNNGASATQTVAGGNMANITQFGDGNMAFAIQEGPDNTITIDQGDGVDDGNSNTANVTQLGDTGDTNVSQLGDSNTATVNQNGDDGFIILAQGGDSNVATITQNSTAVGATIDVLQNGNNGTTTIVQN